jgi:hypothetical protein
MNRNADRKFSGAEEQLAELLRLKELSIDAENGWFSAKAGSVFQGLVCSFESYDQPPLGGLLQRVEAGESLTAGDVRNIKICISNCQANRIGLGNRHYHSGQCWGVGIFVRVVGGDTANVKVACLDHMEAMGAVVRLRPSVPAPGCR